MQRATESNDDFAEHSVKLAHEHYLDLWLGLYEYDSYKRWLFGKVVIPLLNEYLKEGEKVLEIGCSKGYLLRELEGQTRTSVGVDISLTALGSAKSNGALIVRADGETLPFASDSFGGVLAIHTLEHLPSPLSAIQEAYRALRDGGLFLGITPNRTSWFSKIAARKMKYTSLKNPYHIGLMDRDTLDHYVLEAGFRIHRILPFHNGLLGLPKLQKYFRRTFLPLSRRILIPNAHHQLVIALK